LHKVVEYGRFTPQFRQLVDASKRHVWPNFGEQHDRYILLKAHGSPSPSATLKPASFHPPLRNRGSSKYKGKTVSLLAREREANYLLPLPEEGKYPPPGPDSPKVLQKAQK